ncbi:potassium-transporting ATPase subunit KdpC [Phenylobacterium sp. LjRoot225]|uniref:potassium-transporting ATPase subunit KdpC n=1 Tax=Phenylobacterium sp. LjRoot225 TaxID=3342285 RepID=UPI003ED043DA
MLAQIRPALVSTLVFTLLLGVGYPLLVTGIGQLAFPAQAAGSLIRDRAGQVIGSRLIAQGFSQPQYLHPRPSAAGAGYDPTASAGSNLGPLNPALADRVAKDAEALRAANASARVAGDAVTTSASGLDPDVSPANALSQAARIAAARGVPAAEVERVIRRRITPPALGVLGQPRVNVLETNLDLDAAFPRAQPSGQ